MPRRPHINPAPKPRTEAPGRSHPFNFNLHGFGFGHSASAQLSLLHSAVVRAGTSLVGGDFSGTGRGDYGIDIQAERVDPNQVANGGKALALGNENTASALGATALGRGCTANGINSVGLGFQAWGGNDDAIAIGSNSFAGGLRANALGQLAAARVDKTTVISGPICGQVGNFQVQADWFQQLASAEVILRFGWIDPKVAADYSFNLPAGCRFWADECGLLVSSFSAVTVQPFVHFGWDTMNTQGQVANVQTTLLTAQARRQTYVPLRTDVGQVGLLFGIAVGMVGAEMMVSPYFRGVLMESS